MTRGAPGLPTVEPIDLTPGEHGHVFVDDIVPGAPLVITFGFYVDPNTTPAQFEFLGRLRKLEAISGRRVNKLLVRDPSMRWYLSGIRGVGADVESTVAALRDAIERLQPSSVITVGQSMGAYAAIVYGALLRAQKVVAFGSLSCFDERRWALMGERRWLPALEALRGSGAPFAAYSDLPTFLEAFDGPLPDIDLIYGRWAGPSVDSLEAVSIDTAHAMRFANCDAVTILPMARSQHTVVEYFRSRGVITQVLEQRIFGTSLSPTIEGLHGDDQWVAWVVENVRQGMTFEALRPSIVEQDSEHVADSVIARAEAYLDLTVLEQSPPVFTA